MEIEKIYEAFLCCSSVSIDTRTIEDDAMFFAIKGENFDGNKFALQAIEKGAKCAVVSDPSLKHEQFIHVPETLLTLQKLSNFHRRQLKDTKFIGLTGSNGKTTTKELIAQLLSEKFKVQYTAGNYNNHLGVPLTLLTIQHSTEIAVIEMGANHLKEIEELCEIAEPDFGIITNIGKAHIGEFGGQENIFIAKTELYEFLKKNGGTIFYDSSSAWLPKALETYSNKVTYVECLEHLDFKLLGFKPKITCLIKGEKVELDLGGKHNVQNLKAAICVAFNFGLEPKEIINGLASFKAPENRSQWVKTKRNSVFLDAYNSNPSSMKAAVDYLLELDREDKILILGEMLELGEYSAEEHSYLFNYLTENSKEFYLVGKSYAHINSPYVFSDLATLKESVPIREWNGKTVMLKGSRGMKMEQLMEDL